MTPEQLVAARAALRLSGRDFAELLGVDDKTIVRWENGQARIPPMLALVLAGIRQTRAAMTGNHYPLAVDIQRVMLEQDVDQDTAIRMHGVLP